MKNKFIPDKKTIIVSIIGALLFMELFMFVWIPSPTFEVNFHTAYSVDAFFAALFGPVAGCLIAFFGHLLADTFLYGSPWISWTIASGVLGYITGLSAKKLRVNQGIFTFRDALIFNIYQLIGNIVAWLIVAPILDIIIYKEPPLISELLMTCIPDSLSMGVTGTLMIYIYTRIFSIGKKEI